MNPEIAVAGRALRREEALHRRTRRVEGRRPAVGQDVAGVRRGRVAVPWRNVRNTGAVEVSSNAEV